MTEASTIEKYRKELTAYLLASCTDAGIPCHEYQKTGPQYAHF